MIIDNVFVIWTVELFLLIYVSSVANNIRLGKEDNLYTKWTDKMESLKDEPDGYFAKIAKNLFGNIFKKFPNEKSAKEPPTVKSYDKFAFVHERFSSYASNMFLNSCYLYNYLSSIPFIQTILSKTLF